MLEKLLKEVVTIVVGKQAEQVSTLLDSKKHVNEFLIAKKMDITINQTRNILYRLSDYGLVSSIRKKDKKKGWYTYFWKFEILKVLEFLKAELEKKIEQLNRLRSSRKTKQYYVCERCSIEFNEEKALLYDFTCNDCGNVFVIKDTSKEIKELEKALNKFQRELVLVESEIEKENARLLKIREKEIKQAEKEKAEKRKASREKAAKTRAKKKAAKEKEERKAGKKKFLKKKVSKNKANKKVARKKSIKRTTKKEIGKNKFLKKKAVSKKIAKKKLPKKKVSKKNVGKKTTNKKKIN